MRPMPAHDPISAHDPMPPHGVTHTHTALESALAAGLNRPDRLPGLVAIFNRLPKFFGEELDGIAFVQPKITLKELSSGCFVQFCPASFNGVAALVRAERLKGSLCFLADPLASFAFLEASLGHDFIVPSPLPARPATDTECSIIRVLFRRLARSLTSAFSALVDVVFEVENTASDLEFQAHWRPMAPVIAARLGIEFAGCAGEVVILIPQELLAPIRSNLEVLPLSDAPPVSNSEDLDWTRRLNEELSRAFIGAVAVLEESVLTLGDVARFRVGSTIELTSKSPSRAAFEVDGNPIFWCDLGRRDGSLVVRIDDDFDADDQMPADDPLG